MGLFRVRRQASKDHSKDYGTSDRMSSHSVSSSADYSKLFADDDYSSDDDSYTNIPSTSTERPEVRNSKDHSNDLHDTITRGRVVNQQTSPIRVNNDHSSHGNAKLSKTHEVLPRLVRRETVKRSISRKVARSENRRQLLNIRDERSTVTPREYSRASNSNQHNSASSPSNASTSNVAKTDLETNISALSMSPVTPALTREDVITEDAFSSSVLGSLAPASALSIEAATFAMPNSGFRKGQRQVQPKDEASSSSKGRSRRRPPPLGSETKPTDSAADWPSGAIFASDGGFMTGGFRITAEGMMDRPDLETRQDSDPEADESAPRSERLVLVRALKEFRNGPVIGAGAAGRVYLAEHVPSKITMAVKAVNVYNKEKRNQLLKELETLCTYISRYLVRFHGAFYDGSGAVHIALEYMDHGCLASFVQRCGPIPERIVQMIAQDCLRGLRFLHRHHVLHRDFKTANILLSRRSCRAKLSDFGLARDLHPGVSKVDTFVGTVAYMSPERLQGGKYTYASDVWALGVSLVECLIGRHPFNKPQTYFDYIEATAASGTLEGFGGPESRFSQHTHDFITECLYTDPKKRPQAVKLLDHPWIKGQRRDAQAFGAWLDDARTISMRVSSKTKL